MGISKEYISYLEHKVAKLEYQNKSLRDSEKYRADWLRDAKDAAGFHQNISFDIVWSRVLKGYKQSVNNKLWQSNLIKE